MFWAWADLDEALPLGQYLFRSVLSSCSNTPFSGSDGHEWVAPLRLHFLFSAPRRPVVIICQDEKKQENSLSPQMPCLVPFPYVLPLPGRAPLEQHAVNNMVKDPSSHPTRVTPIPTLDPGSPLPSGECPHSGVWPRDQLLPKHESQCPGIGPSSQAPETPGSFMPMSSVHTPPVSGSSSPPQPVCLSIVV